MVIYLVLVEKRKTRLSYIKKYRFNSAIGKKVQEKYPHLTNEQLELVYAGLKEYFYICNHSKRKMVAMPSQVVDVAWHEFILFTQAYQNFCSNALGRFLHHTPTEAMESPTKAREGIKRAWRLACERSNISPKHPTHLPLLFAIDSALKIDDGFTYSLNCQKQPGNISGDFCASHIGCTSGCAGDSGGSSSSSGVPVDAAKAVEEAASVK